MTAAARRALAADPSFVIIIGSDAPAVPLEFLEAARATLSRGAPAVLGPALDGGYYLLGLRQCPARLLTGLAWSDEHTLARTAKRLRECGLTPEYLPSCFDVDLPADVRRLRELIDAGFVNLPHTARAIRELETQ
jgi:glycosyltransferase A (GT-A) superfamily protein (DUF2064 family)